MESLTRLLNNHVFHYEGSPLKELSVTADGPRLKLKGTVHKGIDLPFTILADPSVDGDGALRLRAHSIKALGIPTKGLLSFFVWSWRISSTCTGGPACGWSRTSS
jgi:hypothetical protein